MWPISLLPNNLLNMKVSQLFYPTINPWNRELIASFMNAQDTFDICKIHIHSRVNHDVIIWKPSPNSAYTIKSHYKMCLSLSNQGTHYQASGDWKLVRNMSIPPKLKHFLWRLLHYCLSMCFNLQGHGVHRQSTCVVYNNDIKDKMHIFMHCTFAINCWKDANLWGKWRSIASGSFSSIIFTILATLNEETCAHFLAIKN